MQINEGQLPEIEGKLTIKAKKNGRPLAFYDTPRAEPALGCPSKYHPEFCQKIEDFFRRPPYRKEGKKEIANDMPWFFEFADLIGVDEDTLGDWNRQYPDFRRSFNKCKKLQVRFLTLNAKKGLYAPGFCAFMLKNIAKWQDEHSSRWSDQTDVTHTTSITFADFVKEAVSGKVRSN